MIIKNVLARACSDDGGADGGMPKVYRGARGRLMAETKGDGKSRVLAAKTGPLLRGNSTGNLVT